MIKHWLVLLIFGIILFSYSGVIFASDVQCSAKGSDWRCRPVTQCSGATVDASVSCNMGVVARCCCFTNCSTGPVSPGPVPPGQINFGALEAAIPNFKFTGLNANIGAIVSTLVPWVFGLAGIILLLMLILGGFQLMTSGGDPKAAMSAKGHLTGALIGFLIIFCAYWLVQILQAILGINTGLF